MREEHARRVRQCRKMKLVVLLRVFNIVVMDEAATVEFLLCTLLCFIQIVKVVQ